METIVNLPPELLKFLVYVLGSGFIASGLALISVIAFLGRGVLARLQRNEEMHDNQFATFGKQLAAVQKSLDEDLHRHDVRIVKLEEWRRGIDRTRSEHAGED